MFVFIQRFVRPRSDLCCFSFHPVKAATTGEGGAVTTNDADLAERLRRFRHHGIVARPEDGGWSYDVVELAMNYRLTDIQAALGTSQLAKLAGFIERRQAIAARYRVLLADLPVEAAPAPPDGFTHAYHLFPIRVPRRREIYDKLRAAGIGVQVHYVPIHRHPVHRRPCESFPECEAAYAGLLSLPMFPDLTDAEQDQVVHALREALGAHP